MKNDIIIFGLGDLSKRFLVPSLLKLHHESGIESAIIDVRPLDELLGRPPFLSEEERNWVKERFLQDDGKRDFPEILERIQSLASRRVGYISTPINAIPHIVKRYGNVINTFVLEKPWAQDLRQLEEIVDILKRSPTETKLLGVDHYQWKVVVNAFIKEIQNFAMSKVIDNASSFDFVLCESKLDPIERGYFWQTGVAIDMIPHVLTILDDIFHFFRITIEGATPKICKDETVYQALELYNAKKEFPIKETFAEILLNLNTKNGKKKIRVILGKGVDLDELSICDREVTSSKFLRDHSNKIFLDLINNQFAVNCNFTTIKSEEDERVAILRSLANCDYSGFIDVSELRKYIELYPIVSDQLQSFQLKESDYKLDLYDYVPTLLRKNLTYKKNERI